MLSLGVVVREQVLVSVAMSCREHSPRSWRLASIALGERNILKSHLCAVELEGKLSDACHGKIVLVQ